MSMMIYKDDELDTITNINKQVETREIGLYDISGARRLTTKTSNNVSVGRFSPFRVGLKTPISVNLKSPMHHVCY